MAVIITIGINTDGRGEVSGLGRGTFAAALIWTELPRQLTPRTTCWPTSPFPNTTPSSDVLGLGSPNRMTHAPSNAPAT